MNRKRVGLIVGAWDLAWKVVAIRKAIGNRQYRWAWSMLFVSSAGILPILYLLRFQEPEDADTVSEADWEPGDETA